MKSVKAGVLDIAYLESGPSEGDPVILLHGFPYDIHCYDEVSARLVEEGLRVIVPYLRGYGATRFLSSETARAGQQAALGGDLLALLDALNMRRAMLAGFDWGGRAACVVAALHPDRVSGLVSAGTGYNIQNAAEVLKPASPEHEQRHWYWFYLSSERGATALENDRAKLCRYLWQTFSPTWQFDEDVFARTAEAFANPDFVRIVLHSYRYRIGAAAGDPALEGWEQKLSAGPTITVPSIVLEGADDGVDPPDFSAKTTTHFSTLRRHTILPGIGHNVPQEAPEIFASAIMELAR